MDKQVIYKYFYFKKRKRRWSLENSDPIEKISGSGKTWACIFVGICKIIIIV